MKTDLTEIMNWDERFRLKFINSISGYKGVHLIGTKSKSGNTNLAIFNSIVHIGSSPPFGYLIRAICTILSFITLSPVDSISKNTKSLSKLNFMSCICRCRFICVYYLRSIVKEYETNYIDVCTNI